MNGHRRHRGIRSARSPGLFLLRRRADLVPTGERPYAHFRPPNCLTDCLARYGATVQNLANVSSRRALWSVGEPLSGVNT